MEFLAAIALILILIGLLLPGFPDSRDEARKVRCASNLKQLGTAMNIYLTTLGGGKWYAQPADVFHGDTWLLSLYWNGIVKEPKLFVCPNSSDSVQEIAKLLPNDYAAAIPANAISYTGRCHGLSSNAWRNTTDFSKDAFFSKSVPFSASMMACDDAQGTDNHADGLNAVYFDSHVEFVANRDDITAYSQVGTRGTTWANGELEKMDSGGGN